MSPADKSELRGAIDEGVDPAELRAVVMRLLREKCNAAELIALLESLAPTRRAMNDEPGEEAIRRLIQNLRDGFLA